MDDCAVEMERLMLEQLVNMALAPLALILAGLAAVVGMGIPIKLGIYKAKPYVWEGLSILMWGVLCFGVVDIVVALVRYHYITNNGW